MKWKNHNEAFNLSEIHDNIEDVQYLKLIALHGEMMRKTSLEWVDKASAIIKVKN